MSKLRIIFVVSLLVVCARPADALDANNNGMSDVWEKIYQVPADAGALDYNGNGFSNKEKSALGLDPRDPNSRFHVEVIPGTAQSNLHLILDTAYGKVYTVDSSTDRVTWTPIQPQSSVTGTGGIVDFIVTWPNSSIDKIFFRHRFSSDIDQDGDGLTAWEEQQLGTSDQNVDSDNDGMPDAWEFSHNLDPLRNDSTEDPDGDELPNSEEYELSTDPHDGSSVTGVTQGKLTTQPSGGIAYELPITAAPGTAGMQPKLTFQYSSGGRNGALGMGWAIGGLSAITRAPQTLAQDGSIHGVDMTNADRYAMDGQRLILKSGTEGQNQAEYRTEVNSFTKVIANGQSGSGPETFTAYTKSGVIYTFGGPNGASYRPSGRQDTTTILTWLVSKIQDQAGNYMTFQYSPEGNLASVNYAMNQAAGVTSPYASVEFQYDSTRPDPTVAYLAGGTMSMQQRLSAVTSKSDGKLVRRYHLKYEVSINTKKSRLLQIREVATGGAYAPLRFAWNNPDGALNLSSIAGGEQEDHTRWIQGDFNGDGSVDLVRARDNHLHVFTIPGDGSLHDAGSMGAGQTFDDTDTWLQGDFSGDGKLDLIRIWKSPDKNPQGKYDAILTLFTNTGNYSGSGDPFQKSVVTPTNTVNFETWKLFAAVDANGDGKLDIICINRMDGHTNGPLDIKVYLNNPDGTTPGQFKVNDWTPSGTDTCQKYDRWFTADFNGDGLPDLAKVYNANKKHSIRVYLNQADKRFSLAATLEGYRRTLKPNPDPTADPLYAYTWLSGDFNGDGLADLACIPRHNNLDNTKAAQVLVSDGTGKFSVQTWHDNLVVSDDADGNNRDVQSGDYNADGRADLMVLREDLNGAKSYTVTRSTYLSDGQRLYPQPVQSGTDQVQITSESTPTFKEWFSGDFNGDGKEDLVQRIKVTDSQYSAPQRSVFTIYRTSAGFQDLLTDATDSVGSTTSVEFLPLTASKNSTPIFTKSTGAPAPVIDLVVPMPVVASITYDNGFGAPGSTESKYSVNYHYEGLRAHPLRGMLGFRAVEAIDSRPVNNPNPSATPNDTLDSSVALHTKTWFKQGFPTTEAIKYAATGMAEYAATYLAAPNATKQPTDSPVASDGWSSFTKTTYADGPIETGLENRVFFPYASRSHAYSWDLNRAPTSDTETVAQQMDVYGNTVVSVIRTRDIPSETNFFIKTTTSVYPTSPDLARWRIGQVTHSSVVHEAPGRSAETRTSGFSYDTGNGQVGTETEEPEGTSWATTTYGYDGFGNTNSATITGQEEGVTITPRETTTSYDPPPDSPSPASPGRFLYVTTNALSHTETKDYDLRFGGVTKISGPNELSDTAQYDGFSRKVLDVRADETRTATRYEQVAGNSNAPNAPANAVYLIRITPDDAPERITYFDRLGRDVRGRTLNAKGEPVLLDTTYDYRGRKKTVTKPYFEGASPITATTVYDAVDRPRQVFIPVRDEGGNVHNDWPTTTSYNGLETTIINPKTQRTFTRRDAAGHVKHVEDAVGGFIDYTYDSIGQLVQTHDSTGNDTFIHYDQRGRKEWVDDPDLGKWYYKYYATGELKSQKDANDQEVTFDYDQLGRIRHRFEPNGGDVTEWKYDTAPGKGIGKLHVVEVTRGETHPYSSTLSYDSLGRPGSQSTVIGGTTYNTATSYYDEFSRVKDLTYPTGFAVRHKYNAAGFLTDIKSPDETKSYWSVADNAGEYDAEGRITRETYGNGVVTDRIYVPENGLLKQIMAGANAAHDSVQDLEYHFDVLGNLKTRTDKKQIVNGGILTETFGYDDVNRLTSSQLNGQAPQSFAYNDSLGLGNISSKAGVGNYQYTPASGSLRLNERPHPHAVRRIVGSGQPDFTYDMNGNMLAGKGRNMTWTWFNMPNTISMGGITSAFAYDPDHNRIKQTVTGPDKFVETTYVGGFYERVSEGQFIYHKHYINAPTGRLAVFTQKVQDVSIGNDPPTGTLLLSDTKYLHKDHLGSIDAVTSEAGAVLERDSFDAWGFRRTTDWQGQMPSSYRSTVSRGFTDHEELDDFGLVHMNGRIYDPGLGRFLSADPFVQAPMVTQNFNRYSYVVNNPLSLSDPTGFNIFGDFFNWLNQSLGSTGAQIVIAAAAVVVGCVTMGAATSAGVALLGADVIYTTAGTLSLTGSIVAGAGFGFGSAFTGTLLSGASVGQAFQAAAIGAAIGAVSGGIAHGIGDIFPAKQGFLANMFSGNHLGRAIGHAALGGVTSEIQNGDWEEGAISAGVTEALEPAVELFDNQAGQLAASAAIGGTAAQLGGGKFANGAVTAAFMYLFNDAAHGSGESKEDTYPRFGDVHQKGFDADGWSATDWYADSDRTYVWSETKQINYGSTRTVLRSADIGVPLVPLPLKLNTKLQRLLVRAEWDDVLTIYRHVVYRRVSYQKTTRINFPEEVTVNEIIDRQIIHQHSQWITTEPQFNLKPSLGPFIRPRL
jgi:RHS repeat-associated protein